MITDIQFSAAHNDWPALRDAVLQAEAEGFDTTWVFDHFDGALLGGDRPILECFTLLGAMAAVTSTIGLGTLVANVANRHAAVLTAATQSVQRISGGRMHLGIGAGAGPDSRFAREHHERNIGLDADLGARHRAVVANIDAVRAVVDVPIIVGVNSDALARVAGEVADGVNVRLSSAIAPRLVQVARDAAGDRPFEVSGWCHLRDAASRELAHDLAIDRLILTRLEPLG